MRYDWWTYAKSMIQRYKSGNVSDAEKNAVEAAIDVTKELMGGEDRLKIIELVFWERTHTLDGAAMQIPCGWRTAQRWQADFIMEVAKNFCCNGLI